MRTARAERVLLWTDQACISSRNNCYSPVFIDMPREDRCNDSLLRSRLLGERDLSIVDNQILSHRPLSDPAVQGRRQDTNLLKLVFESHYIIPVQPAGVATCCHLVGPFHIGVKCNIRKIQIRPVCAVRKVTGRSLWDDRTEQDRRISGPPLSFSARVIPIALVDEI